MGVPDGGLVGDDVARQKKVSTAITFDLSKQHAMCAAMACDSTKQRNFCAAMTYDSNNQHNVSAVATCYFNNQHKLVTAIVCDLLSQAKHVCYSELHLIQAAHCWRAAMPPKPLSQDQAESSLYYEKALLKNWLAQLSELLRVRCQHT